MSKVDFKKEYRKLYKPKKEFEIVDVPEFNYLMIDGEGNPNISEKFDEAMDALFGMSYNIKFNYKEKDKDYVVMPLEGLWWTEDMSNFTMENKDNWQWTMMIMQPDFVSEAVVEEMRDKVYEKKGIEIVNEVRLDNLEEGKSAQILYQGPYDEEGPVVEELHNFINEKGYKRDKKHHEIYLSNPQRTAPEKLKTIIRQPVKE